MVPKRLQGVLWSRSIEGIDVEKDKNYIVHQILAYGTCEDLRWLFATYDKSEIRDIFTKYPQKDYVMPAFKFVKNILLGIKESNLDAARYDRNAPRITG